MAIKSRDEILASVRERLGEDTSDEALAFVTDVADTLADFEQKASGQTDWEKKYRENDEAWRKKYRDRFFSDGDDDDDDVPPPQNNKKLTFENLFK